MANKPSVLRIKRLDTDEPSFVLVLVTADGPSLLDLKLVATEGSSPYVGTIRHDAVHEFRAKNYQGSAEEWERILNSLLLRNARQHEPDASTQGVEVKASVQNDEETTISIRRHIGGITQRLGTLSLKQDEDQEIQLFDWAAAAAETASSAEQDLSALSVRYQSQKDLIDSLNKQLEDLVEAKRAHENELLEKFRELLNSKKLKIRDQQRLLNEAKIDPAKGKLASPTPVRSSRGAGQSRKPGNSRAGKRKNTQNHSPSERHTTDSEDDVFEAMDTEDSAVEAMDIQEENRVPIRSRIEETPDRSSETEDEMYEEPVAKHLPGKVELEKDARSKSPEQREGEHKYEDTVRRTSPPPRRELPFLGKGSKKDGGSKVADDTGSETEDDEL
ncbi:MAG: hypothetical protein M1833_001569 [Piccolia ochrophora]|nr:MAG: hypothetical protein M1833_001569 [Piccolia ochrophora]